MTLGVLSAIGTAIIAILSYIMGRVFSQSEAILSEKRRVYELFLTEGPVPNDIFQGISDKSDDMLQSRMKATFGPLLLFGSPLVIESARLYIDAFNSAVLEPDLGGDRRLAKRDEVNKAHNDLILAMQKDALGWSAFGFKGKTRVEKAKANT